MEYAPGGDLLRYVKKRGRLSENSAKRIFADIVAGKIFFLANGL
jgi:serine/threonine protein kinase